MVVNNALVDANADADPANCMVGPDFSLQQGKHITRSVALSLRPRPPLTWRETTAGPHFSGLQGEARPCLGRSFPP